MAGYNGLPPEETLPAPEVCPPPEEGSFGSTDGGTARGGKAARRRSKNALLLAFAGSVLIAVICAAPMEPAAAEPPEEPPAAEAPIETPVEETVEEPSAARTAAERLAAVGTWKNADAGEWAHFNADGTGWWYDGTYFGFMAWEEDADGGVAYKASMSYLGPEREYIDEHAPEKEGDSLQIASSRGDVALLADEDRFTCPGLRFGEGTYLPDDTPIDASVMDGVLGKTVSELLFGTAWHMTETSDLGIPTAPSEGGGKPELYTDLVYVQSMDFAAGTFRLATRDGGLMEREEWASENRVNYTGEISSVMDAPFTLSPTEGETVSAWVKFYTDFMFNYRSDYREGDVEYSNMHLLWGKGFGRPSRLCLLVTGEGVRLGIEVDLYPHNYTLLARDLS